MTRDINELPAFQGVNRNVAPGETRVVIAAPAQPVSPMQSALNDSASMAVSESQQAILEAKTAAERLRLQAQQARLQDEIDAAEDRAEERRLRRERRNNPQPQQSDSLAPVLTMLMEQQKTTQTQLQMFQSQMLEQSRRETESLKEIVLQRTNTSPASSPVEILRESVQAYAQLGELAKQVTPQPPVSGGGDVDAHTLLELAKAQNELRLQEMRLQNLQNDINEDRALKRQALTNEADRTSMLGDMVKQVGPPIMSLLGTKGAQMLGLTGQADGGGNEQQPTTTATVESQIINCPNCAGPFAVPSHTVSSAVCPHCGWTVYDDGTARPPALSQPDNVLPLMPPTRPTNLAQPVPPGSY